MSSASTNYEYVSTPFDVDDDDDELIERLGG